MVIHKIPYGNAKTTNCGQSVQEIRTRSLTEDVTTNPANVTCPNCRR